MVLSQQQQNWIRSELAAKLGNFNEYLRRERVPFVLTDAQCASASFEFTSKPRSTAQPIPLEDAEMPDEYRYGRILGRVYHRVHNTDLFEAAQDDAHRKLGCVVEHCAALLYLRSIDYTSRLMDALDEFVSARDLLIPFHLIEFPSWQQEHRRKKSTKMPLHLGEPDNTAGYGGLAADVAREEKADYPQERKGKEEPRGYQFMGGVEKFGDNINSDDAAWRASLDEPDAGFLETGYEEYEADIHLDQVTRARKDAVHDAFFAALAIIEPGRVEQTWKTTLNNLLRSGKEDALAAIYQIIRF